MHRIFPQLKCCGVNGPSDWEKVIPNNKIPGTCCHLGEGTMCDVNDANVIKEGCKAKFIDYIKSNILKVAGVGIAVAVVQVSIYA